MKFFSKLIALTILLETTNCFGFVDDSGITYDVIKNKHGVVLKSKKITVYLGKDCDAIY